ncbi:C1orf87 [Bugula neritina]|uniref:C1orf87 n=1 Tax=Bugula neritina TaxID=10212 RepID=A0A7J7IXR1_BUGNE|nr:C1orf87 [Bugula neritina]
MPKCGRRADLPPFEGHVSGIMTEGFINRNAPFGTQFTPTFRTKIVGGKPRYVKETQKSFRLSKEGRLIQTPTANATQDDGVQTEFGMADLTSSEGAYTKQQPNSEWKNHAVLPPIPSSEAAYNKTYHQSLSENGVANPLGKSPEVERKVTHGQSHGVHSHQEANYQPKVYDNSEVHKQYQWKPAAGYSYLPTQPITLSKDQEMFLLHKLAADVSNCDVDQTKHVYQEMAAKDRSLSGWGSYTDFGIALQKHGQQLLQSDNPLDTEQLRAAFSKADRSHRLTLSQSQVKEICKRMKVPIHEQVINEMLAHCHTHGDGQYLWTDFIEILERVQPQATGLFIPKSKRPLEYAKKYLQPNENWPHPDPSRVRLEPINSEHAPSNSKPLHLDARETLQPTPERTAHGKTDFMPNRTLQHQNVSAPAALNTQRAGKVEATGKQEQVSPRGLGLSTIPKVQPWSKEVPDPWFTGFRKMAEALYRNDLDRKGSMKAEQCRWLISEYNEIFDLQLQPEEIAHCIHRNTTASGTEIDGLLQHLLAFRTN